MALISNDINVAFDSKSNKIVQNQSLRVNPKSTDCYNSSYVLYILHILNQIGMAPLEQTMRDEAALMDITDKIQKQLTNIQSFYQKIENQAGSTGAWIQYHYHAADYIGPNAYDGLSANYYRQTVVHKDPGPGQTRNTPNQSFYGSELVSEQFQKDVAGFLTAIRTLYQCGTITGEDAVPASELKSFTVKRINPSNGQYDTIKVDMTSTYNSLETGAFGSFSSLGVHTFVDPTQSGSTSSSLYMQYVFDKARVVADTLHTTDLLNIAVQDPTDPNKWEIKDATKIIDFDPTESSGDAVLRVGYQLLNDLSVNVSVSRSNYFFLGYNSSVTGNILQMMFDTNGPDLYQGQWDALHSPVTENLHYYQPLAEQHLGLYGAFSYMAFNYFWSKNPGASVMGIPEWNYSDPVGDKERPLDGNDWIYAISLMGGDSNYKNGIWAPDGCDEFPPYWNTCPMSGDKGNYGDMRGNAQENRLGILANSAQSSISLISSANNETSTAMQEFTSQESQFQNIGQNIIKENTEDTKNSVNNNNI